MKTTTNRESIAVYSGASAPAVEAEEFHGRRHRAEELIELVGQAFQNVELGDGIGLYESDGIDGYLCSEALEQLRAKDEKKAWPKISADSLNYCNAAPSFLDAEGMRFHTPAFLIAELKKDYHHDFLGRLIDGSYVATDFGKILTADQRAAIVACIRFYGSIEHFGYTEEQINAAVARFS